MRIILVGLILFIAVSTAFFLPDALAAEERPAAAEFNFGARLDVSGQQTSSAVSAAAGLGLDWMAVDFDWAAMMPDPNQLPDLSMLNAVMETSRQNQLRVMLTLTHAPGWAITPSGPDANVTASLLISLTRLYGEALGAIELYPAANTLKGWGAAPDPTSYASLIQIVDSALEADGRPVTLVASLAPAQEAGDIDDRTFLEELYKLGAAQWMPVLGLRLPGLSGAPKADPASGMVLRHYEVLRQVMLQQNHSKGQIWITGFSWPSESKFADPEIQAQWLNRAFQLLRAQLYVGAAFFQQLNPPTSGTDPSSGLFTSLILPDGALHPACTQLSQLTSLDANIQTVNFESAISKKTPMKILIKP
jgi:hypothetical protein